MTLKNGICRLKLVKIHKIMRVTKPTDKAGETREPADRKGEMGMQKSSRRVRKGKRFRNMDLFLLLLPAVIQVLIFRYWPIAGIQIAFKDFSARKGIWGSEWIGFDHFLTFFRSYNFWEILGNTLGLSLAILVFSFPIPFIFALFLNRLTPRFKKVLQTTSYAPYFISTVVLVGMLYNFFSASGIVNIIMGKLGFETVNYMGKASCFVPLYVGSAIWQTMGYSAVIYIASLSNVNQELYEAAKIDGANKMQTIWHIDVPALIPTLLILLIMQIGQIMNIGYEKVYLMQNALNLSKSEIISTYVYKLGLQQARYDFSTAVNLFNTVINFIILMLVNKVAKKTSGTSLW